MTAGFPPPAPDGPSSPAPAGLFRAFIVRNLRQQPLRSVATIASLAVGVAVVVAIQLANASSVRGFSTALDALAGRTSLEITVPGVGLDEVRLADLGWLRQYGLVSPLIDADALLEIAAEEPVLEAVRLLGVDILRDRPFRDYPLVDGDTPRLVTTQGFLDLLTDPQAVILTRTFAARHGLDVGDRVALVVGERTAPLRVAGILGDEGPAQVLDGNFALMDIAAAQWSTGRLGRVDRVDVRLADDVDIEQAEREIAARLPAGITVRRPSSRGAEVERMLRAFQFNLTALSLIALIVGLFLVYNTVAVSVITRRHEIGLLRTLGVTRRAVVALFLGEAGALALLGCALGAPLGWLLAHGAVRLTSSTVSQFWIVSSATVPPLEPRMVGLAFAVGLPLALVAAAAPALEAARLTPLAAVRGDEDLDTRGRLPWRFVTGPLAFFAAGAWLATLGPVGGLPVFGMLAALAVVLGAGMAMPAVLFGFRRTCGAAMARWLRVEGRLAHANLGSAIPRLSISVAALAVSLAMMAAIAIMVGELPGDRRLLGGADPAGRPVRLHGAAVAGRRAGRHLGCGGGGCRGSSVGGGDRWLHGHGRALRRLDDHRRGGPVRHPSRARRPAVQGSRRRGDGDGRRCRARSRRRLGGVLAEVRSRRRRRDPPADPCRFATVPGRGGLLRLLQRPRTGGDGRLHVRAPLRAGSAERTDRLPRARRRPGDRPATSCAPRSDRNGASSSRPTPRCGPPCCASSTRRSPSPTRSRSSPSASRCSGWPPRCSPWCWSGGGRSRCCGWWERTAASFGA